MKLILAILLSPLTPLLFFIPYDLLEKGSLDDIGAIVFMCVFYGYPAMLVIALPLHFGIGKKKELAWWYASGVGGSAGFVIPSLIFIPMLLFSGAPSELMLATLGLALQGGFLGSTAAFTFWFIVYYNKECALIENTEQ